jgi:hypothetical protein
VVLKILRTRKGNEQPAQYETLKATVTEELEQQDAWVQQPYSRNYNYGIKLSRSDAETLLEVFWGLFREGIITLGLDHHNREFP